MSDQKNLLVDSLNPFVSSKIQDTEQLAGKALPASVIAVDPTNTIVTVKFEVKTKLQIPMVQCPIGFPEWIRFPISAGDKGFVIAVDTYMGGMSGIGGGIATLVQQANLATLVWFPCGNTGFDPTDDPNSVVIYGPAAVILRDRGNNGPGINGSSVQIKIDSAGNVQLWGATSLSTDVHGYGSRLTWEGGTVWRKDNYVLGATVNNNDLPIHPPKIPDPT